MNRDLSSPELAQKFKVGMQLLAATTTIITTHWEGTRSGMAATAISSLSAEPPSLLVCVNRTSRTCSAISKSGRFAINIVPDDMPALIDVFAAKLDSEEQFRETGGWVALECGLPILDDAVASFACRVDNWIDSSTHAVVFGRVEQMRVQPERSPLVYARQSYHRIRPI